jgi:hypothetical protein
LFEKIKGLPQEPGDYLWSVIDLYCCDVGWVTITEDLPGNKEKFYEEFLREGKDCRHFMYKNKDGTLLTIRFMERKPRYLCNDGAPNVDGYIKFNPSEDLH